MKSFKEFLNEQDISEAIKGWKNAHSDIAAARKVASDEAKSVHLHKLKKDGSESKMHDARIAFNTIADAVAHHDNIKKLNPTRNISHHLYVDGKLKEKLE